ncbi:hypothetical protein V5E97_06545 [Singulisphaera sp. Ch08]|uniref:Uncharacterized protein n=1 Tax=Singulisphaera sp. Ch08 TaxID=3120278 RepID=A0AAU7CKC8_9BACT
MPESILDQSESSSIHLRAERVGDGGPNVGLIRYHKGWESSVVACHANFLGGNTVTRRLNLIRQIWKAEGDAHGGIPSAKLPRD